MLPHHLQIITIKHTLLSHEFTRIYTADARQQGTVSKQHSNTVTIKTGCSVCLDTHVWELKWRTKENKKTLHLSESLSGNYFDTLCYTQTFNRSNIFTNLLSFYSATLPIQVGRTDNARCVLHNFISRREKHRNLFNCIFITLWVLAANLLIFMFLLLLSLRHKPEGRGFDSRWCHWNFLLA